MNREIELILRAKDLGSGAVGKFGGALGSLKGHTAGLGQGLASAGGQIVKLGAVAGAAMAAGIGALIGGLLLAAKASAAEEVGITRLHQALTNNVKGWDGNTAAIEKTIQAQGGLGFDDSALRDSLGQLVARTKDVAEAQRLQVLAMDLARAKGIDLATAAGIVGKVYSGNVGVLSRYGIAVAKGSTATQALAAIQAATAGQAEAYGKTTTGAYEGLQITLGNLVEDVGSAVTPMLVALAGLLTTQLVPAVQGIVQSFTDWVTANQPLIATITGLVSGAITGLVTILFTQVIPFFGQVATAVGDLITANGPLIDQVGTGLNVVLQALGQGLAWVQQNMDIVVPFVAGPLIAALAAWAISAGAAAVATALALAPLLLVGAAIGVLAVAWTQDWGGIQEIVGTVVAAVTPFLRDTLVPAIQTVIDIALKVGGVFLDLFNTVIAPAVSGVLAVLGDVFRNGIQPAIGLVLDVLGKVAAAFSWLFDNVIHPAMEAVMTPLKVVVDGIKGAIDGLLGVVKGILGPMGTLLDVVGKVVGFLLDIIGLGPKAGKAYTGPALGTGGAPPAPGQVLPGKALGGLVRAGQQYLVGERGPEPFVPDVTGRIVPRVGGGAGLGGVVQGGIHLNVGAVPDAEQWSARAVQALVRRLRREGIAV